MRWGSRLKPYGTGTLSGASLEIRGAIAAVEAAILRLDAAGGDESLSDRLGSVRIDLEEIKSDLSDYTLTDTGKVVPKCLILRRK